MEDFRDIEVKAGNHSLIFTIIVGILSLLLLFITLSFDVTKPQIVPIEIAMNFGNTDMGDGDAEPRPAEAMAAPSNNSAPTTSTASTNTSSSQPKVVTQSNAPAPVVKSNPKPKKTPSSVATTAQQPTNNQPQGDARANAALGNLLGGKGKSNSSGQGNDGVRGNVGDPKGSDSDGTGIGENWKSRIPEPQTHNCDASGIIVVDIVVNAQGNISSARPGARGSTSNDTCLKQKAKELVEKYVRAYPGSNGRRGTYKVNLR